MEPRQHCQVTTLRLFTVIPLKVSFRPTGSACSRLFLEMPDYVIMMSSSLQWLYKGVEMRTNVRRVYKAS